METTQITKFSCENFTRRSSTSRHEHRLAQRSESTLRILYTHRTQGVGAEGAHIMGVVEAFKQLGHDVELDCLPGCDPFDTSGSSPREETPRKSRTRRRDSGDSRLRRIYRLIADQSPQAVFGAVELLYNIPLLVRLWGKLRRRPDLVYERYALGNVVAALLCRALRIPLVVEVNDSVVIERSRPLSFPRIKRMFEKRILSSADLVVTISSRFKDQLLESFPRLAKDKILICPNAVSEQRFREPAYARATEDLRARLGLGRRILLGSAGQFVPWHGLAPFVLAMAKMACEEDLGFLFIGDGPVRSAVLETARAAGVQERVVFTGMVPHALIPEYLALLDIAVIPCSNMHGSPMKLMEFMAMGLPVVAPDLPPIREVLENGRTGRLFRPGDMDDMRRHLMELLADREAAQAMGHRARDHVLAHLTWAGHTRTILEALNKY